MSKNTKIEVRDLGTISYQDAWDFQQLLLEKTIGIKMYNREHKDSRPTPNYLLFCEHPHVYSIGKSGDMQNLLLSEEELRKRDIEFYKTNRGGDITYHGPGQMVCYPILDLENFTTDIHLYLRNLEEAVIKLLEKYGLKGVRVEGLTGVWTDEEDPADSRKICAIGVRTSRWVTMHGLALNLNTDLRYFENIVPCGIDDKGVTSLASELGGKVSIKDVRQNMISSFSEVFEAELFTAKSSTTAS